MGEAFLAADDAAPGDALYGIDTALESIGIGDGGTAERLAEASELAANGYVSEALDHAVAALEQARATVAAGGDNGDVDTEDSDDNGEVEEAKDAVQALKDAADQVQNGTAEEESQAVRDAVADMLRWMADQMDEEDFDGRSFGEGVSERARDIAGAPDDVNLPEEADSADLPEEAENGMPEDTPSGP
ncbi:MAG TPA: hypothetical protein EYP73_06355 [Acidimicrobiia bacterium]|nr:hypothetical protein [Acidimicrobiia bacterium]